MLPENVRTLQSAKQIVEDRNLSHVKIAFTDLDGILRGKYISKSKFLSALDKGLGFCDVVFGWDCEDQLYDKPGFTGWQKAFPDALLRIDPTSCRDVPGEGHMLLFLGEFDGPAAEVCPRNVLRRVLSRGEAMGYQARAAAEYEFFAFQETPDSIRCKDYRDLTPLTPGWFGYSLLRTSVHADFYRELMDLGTAMRFPLEGLHTETGAGVIEAALEHADALEAADRAALFKTFSKVAAQRRGLMLTFMAKWSDRWPGQSGHIHVSLRDHDGRPVFHDHGASHGMSQAMRWFIGGQQALMPELLAMVAPTVNSYSRLVPGFWAPTQSGWGIENRTCALRAIPGDPSSQRVEYRIAAADMNPYLAMAAAIGSGLWGIENRIDPGEPTVGNAYEQARGPEFGLPSRLSEAADRLSASTTARKLFGSPFVDHYVMTRHWEQSQFDRSVTEWELRRYFEII